MCVNEVFFALTTVSVSAQADKYKCVFISKHSGDVSQGRERSGNEFLTRFCPGYNVAVAKTM
ncbi:hypothetical protein J6590_033659 [Homalodisca vitripennis]|nr:hypothetical protein J6590_033659 [Homalodisca vitripennis]